MSTPDSVLKQTDFRLCPKCNKLHSGLTTCPKCSSPLNLVDYTFFLNKTLGKYTIEKVIGAGGMGIVYQALHKTLQKKTAIKVFIPKAGDATFEKRFLREARILAGLNHPNIVEVYDFDVSQWGTPYYVMEYLEGKTLGDLINEHPNGFPPGLFDTLLEPIIQGLSHAHKKGIIHRDLKPENIFIEEVYGKQVLKILDFGIAKTLVGEKGDATSLTATETVLGTPFYLAPEQILNKNIGPHTDQYALALIIAEILSGKAVRSGKNIGEILYTEVHKAVRLEEAAFKKIPGEIKKTLIKATTPDPSKRFPDIDSFGAAILNVLRKVPTKKSDRMTIKQPTREKSVTIEEEVRLEAKKKRLLRAGIIAGAVLLIFMVIFFLGIFKGDKGDKAARPGEKPPKEFLTLKQTIKAPPDPVSILTYQENILTLQGSKGVYLIDFKSPGSPEKIPLEDRILGGLPGGNIVLIGEYSITSRNFISGSDDLIIRNPPSGEIFKISKSQKYLAVKKVKALRLYQIANRQLLFIKSITIPKRDAGFAVELIDRYLVFVGDGRIHAYRLDGNAVKEILDQPFAEPAKARSVTIALQDDDLFTAAAGEDDNVHIYDLKKSVIVETVSEPGETLALEFFPHVPVLIISKKGKLIFRKIPGKTLDVYEEKGIAAVDMAVTTHGLITLDKKAGTIKIYSYDKSML